MKLLNTYTLEVKKSKFICYYYEVNTVEEVKNIIESLKKEHKKARHIRYAYKIDQIIKKSDDKEPSGTSGMPILNIIEKNNLNHVLIAIVRYFGGIKLGAGGLTRAYTQSVAEALKEAEIVEKELVDLYQITIDYSYTRKFEHLLKQFNIKCIHQEYNEQVTYHCYLRDLQFLEQIQDLTNNQFHYECIGSDYLAKEN